MFKTEVKDKRLTILSLQVGVANVVLICCFQEMGVAFKLKVYLNALLWLFILTLQRAASTSTQF